MNVPNSEFIHASQISYVEIVKHLGRIFVNHNQIIDLGQQVERMRCCFSCSHCLMYGQETFVTLSEMHLAKWTWFRSRLDSASHAELLLDFASWNLVSIYHQI